MQAYAYTVAAFRDGKQVHRETKTMTSVQLYHETGDVGELAFLRLIDRWNRTGLLGVPNDGPVYVYHREYQA